MDRLREREGQQQQQQKRPKLENGFLPSATLPLFQRRIEFHSERNGYNYLPKGNIKMETVNKVHDSIPVKPSSSNGFVSSGGGSARKLDGAGFYELNLDPELTVGLGLRRIGAGLANLGNTCFLNSVLQCLTYTEPLAAYLQSGKHKSSCQMAGFCAMCAIQSHVSNALQSSGKILSPSHLVRNLRFISRNFRNSRQEDAHEYMVNLMEKMHKCCLPMGVSSESPNAYERSLVHKIFGGQLRSQVKCTQCRQCSDTFDPFLDLSLQIMRADSLTKALHQFTAMEQLDGGERQYQCDNCKQKVRALKQLTIHKVPYVLTIHLKRFGSAGFGEKIDKNVLFGTTLDLKPYVSCQYEGDLKYSLYGVLVHAGGSCHSGHYYCFIRTSSGIWHRLDDNRVSQVSEKVVMNEKAYMLFYVRDRKNSLMKKPLSMYCKENQMVEVTGSNPFSVQVPPSNNHCQNVKKDEKCSSVAVLIPFQPVKSNTSDSANGLASKSTHKDSSSSKTNVHSVDMLHSSGLAKIGLDYGLCGDASVKVDSKVCGANFLLKPCEIESSGQSLKRKSDVLPNVSTRASAPSSDHSTSENGLLHGQADVSGLKNADNAKELENPMESAQLAKKLTSSASDSGALGMKIDDSMERKDVDVARESAGLQSNQNSLPELFSRSTFPTACSQNGNTTKNVSVAEQSLERNASNSDVKSGFTEKHERKSKVRKCKALVRMMPVSRRRLFGKSLKKRNGHKKKPPIKHDEPCKASSSHLDCSDQVRPKKVAGTDKELSQNGVRDEIKQNGSSGLMDGSTLSERVILERRNTSDAVLASSRPSEKMKENDADVARGDDEGNGAGMQKSLLKLLSRGLSEVTIARWDDIEIDESRSNGLHEKRKGSIGYVLDEWDEEYDRGRRKKLKQPKDFMVGEENPFQKIALQKAKLKNVTANQMRSGNQPVRI